MVERFLKQTQFTSAEDYRRNLEFIVPEQFNFAYDVMDEWAAEQPDKRAMIWANDEGKSRTFTFADLKRLSDQAASYFQQLGIGRGDTVMLILKRRYEFWISMLGLQKLGAIGVPATHMLTVKDILYRIECASLKAIICVGEDYVLSQVAEAKRLNASLETVISVGPNVLAERVSASP